MFGVIFTTEQLNPNFLSEQQDLSAESSQISVLWVSEQQSPMFITTEG